jgi:hypothetical protein
LKKVGALEKDGYFCLTKITAYIILKINEYGKRGE